MKAIYWPLVAAALAGCGVEQSKYQAAVEQGEQQQKAAEELQKKLTQANENVTRLQDALAIAESKATTDEQKAQLEEAKRAVEEANSRTKLQADLLARFKKMIDAGALKVTVRHGQLVLALRNDILFETGETELKPEGKKAIQEVGAALRTLKGKRFQVAGHTDSAPIVTKKKEQFPTNWELSAARAITVVKLLTASGVNPASLSAAGYGPNDPVASNATPDGQAKNRRIEVTLQPNVGDLLTTLGPDAGAPPADAKKP